MQPEPRPQPGILDIALYQGGDSNVQGANRVTKLSSNENPFGPSPAARDAYTAAGQSLELYPSTNHAGLREAIAELHGLDAARVICGAGSDELLTLIAQAYCGPGDTVLYPEHGFLMYKIVAKSAGATPIAVPEAQRTVDVDAILASVDTSTRIIYLANPANPTGTIVPQQDINRLAAELPTDIMLVLDGAYAEYVEDEAYDAGAQLASSRPNVVMTRTFSKIYGLGGLRIGWAYASQDIIDVLNRVRGPFNLSAPALATAQAAIRDSDYVETCKAANTQWRAWLTEQLRSIGLACDNSEANFVLARFEDEERALSADQALRSHGIVTRHPKSYGFPEALRITIGDEVACRSVAKILSDHRGISS